MALRQPELVAESRQRNETPQRGHLLSVHIGGEVIAAFTGSGRRFQIVFLRDRSKSSLKILIKFSLATLIPSY